MSALLPLAAALQLLASGTAPSDQGAGCPPSSEQTAAPRQQADARGKGDSQLAKGIFGGLAKGALSAAPYVVGGRMGGWNGYAAQAALQGAAGAASQAIDQAAVAQPSQAPDYPAPDRPCVPTQP